MKNAILMIVDALLFAACIGAPFAAYFYFYGA